MTKIIVKSIVIILLLGGILIAGCSQSQQTCNCPCTCVPTPSSSPLTNVETMTSTSAIPHTETPVPSVTLMVTVTPVATPSSLQSNSVPLSYQAEPLIFTPVNQLGTCSRYEHVKTSSCEAFFSWPSYDFSFRGTGYPITIPVNIGAFQAVKYNSSKMNTQRDKDYRENKIGNYTYGGIGATVPIEDLTRYYNSIIKDPAQDASYNYIANYLRGIRDKNHLDDNEYAELTSLFVQKAVRFSTDPDRMIVKYPVETIGDRSGDCDDRSLLLAGLLSREGYGTALIWFPSGNHMIAGILGDHQALEYDGYLGIETTVPSYVGFYHTKDAFIYTMGDVPALLNAPYMADFKIIKVSDGKPFTAGKELNFIWDQWALFKGYTAESGKYSDTDYANDYYFISNNIENRHMVYQYLTKTGNFR